MLSAALVVVTVLPLTRLKPWWIRVWDFPRLQLACVALPRLRRHAPIHAHVRLPGAGRVEVHFVHPSPPSPTENDASTDRDAELVLVGTDVAGRDVPAIVCGDLNDVAWSRTTRLFRKISGLLDPRRGRGMCNTYHANWFFMRWPLDHLFHSRHFTLVDMRRLSKIGSDHFPVLVRLAYEPERRGQQSAPAADAEDHEEAREKLEKA